VNYIAMPGDSDPIETKKRAAKDLVSWVCDMLGSIQWKLVGFVFLIFIIVSSDVFVGRVLSQFNGAVDLKYPTSWGVILQGLFLSMGLIMIDALIRADIV